MKKVELVEAVAEATGLTKADATRAFDATIAAGGEFFFNTHCFNQAVGDVRQRQLEKLSAELGISPKYNISVGPNKVNVESDVIIDDHIGNLNNSDATTKVLFSMFHNKNLDAGTAFEILSIDIADVDVGRNVGAQLQMDQAEAGDNIGALLRGVAKDGIRRGQVLAKPGSVNPHTNFKGNVYVLSEKEGGRQKPFFAGYRPQFYFRTTDVTGSIELPADVEMCRPGDNVTFTVELITPIACEKGLRFAIREGGRTVGSGVVSEIVE